jgi:hypothetical protein
VSAAPVAFAPNLPLTKEEVFDICSGIANGEAALRGLGMSNEADQLHEMLESLEGRLAESYSCSAVSPSLSYVSESEFTQ